MERTTDVLTDYLQLVNRIFESMTFKIHNSTGQAENMTINVCKIHWLDTYGHQSHTVHTPSNISWSCCPEQFD